MIQRTIHYKMPNNFLHVRLAHSGLFAASSHMTVLRLLLRFQIGRYVKSIEQFGSSSGINCLLK